MSDTDRQKALMARALEEIQRLKAENETLRHSHSTDGQQGDIAVIGLACRMPGAAETPEAFWQLLKDGHCTIAEVPANRWSIDRYFSDDEDAPGKLRCRFGSFLGDVDSLDCRLFGVSPREASYMDPQQRLLLELAWEVLESANVNVDTVRGSHTGVFIGQSGFDFASQHMTEESLEEINPYVGTGCAFSPAAGRISYTFDFTGPSYVVDTACSSSLVALHNACNSIRNGECDMAMVGASNLILGPGMSINFDKVGMLCADGVVKTFDADAHGVVRAEGAGMVLLKRLDRALADGDTIDGVILGSAINQDGASSSLMAPNGRSQRAVMEAALTRAKLTARDIDYLEAHGTATAMGDPTELNSVIEVYCNDTRITPLSIGSLKTNFGHMEASAGIAGVLKILLALRYEEIPRQLNFEQGHPDIDWENVSLSVCSENLSWPRGRRRRIAGVNGFGFAGTNAHVLIAESPQASPSPKDEASDALVADAALLFPLSTATPAALVRQATALADYIEHTESVDDLEGMSAVLMTRRKALRSRAVFVAEPSDKGRAQLLKQLRKFSQSGRQRGYDGEQTLRASGQLSIGMVFCGHGAQYPGMGAHLFATEPVFREALTQVAAEASQHLGVELLPLILHSDDEPDVTKRIGASDITGELARTPVAQLAIFSVQIALSRLWQHWGVRPSVVMGHSLGEYTAACVAGVFSVEDATRLLVERARLMESETPRGAMITAFHDEERVRAIVNTTPDTAIAAVNGPGIVLLSGSEEAIEEARVKVDADGGRVAHVAIDRAFHSPFAESIVEPYKKILEEVSFNTSRIPIISNLTGERVGDEITQPSYWLRHSVESVQFMQGVMTLHDMHLDAVIDVSPEPVVIGLEMCYQQIRAASGSTAFWLPSISRATRDDIRMLESLGQLHRAGLPLPASIAPRTVVRLPRLPCYAFDRQRCWSDAAARVQSASCPRFTSDVLTPTAIAAATQDVSHADHEMAVPTTTARSDTQKNVHAVMLEHVRVVEKYLQSKARR